MTILCIGNDPNILTSRASVLRTTGAEVTATSDKTAFEFIEHERFDLIVVGYSLSEDMARRVYEAAKARIPTPAVLRLRSPLDDLRPQAEQYSDAVANTNPATLVHAAAQLLGVSQ
ncbi:MAG TPA: hypothetical protein VGI45_10530 [Terracidiphilus sp.]|jgi:CheY-like chemotaxis protein